MDVAYTPAPGYSGPGYSGPGYSGPGYSGPGYSGPGYSGSDALTVEEVSVDGKRQVLRIELTVM